MTFRSSLRWALLAVLLVPAGCGGDQLSRTFGLTRDAPDEFTVTTRAPLSMPPDYTLRPPEPGAPRPQEQGAAQSAEAALTPEAALSPQSSGADSAGQDALISAAGPRAPADVRAKVDADAARAANNHSLTDMLMFWKTPPLPGEVVDSSQESQRLRGNAALGQSPDAGETPIIKKKSNSFLDTLF